MAWLRCCPRDEYGNVGYVFTWSMRNFLAASVAVLVRWILGSRIRTTISPRRCTASSAAAVVASYSFSMVSINRKSSLLMPLNCARVRRTQVDSTEHSLVSVYVHVYLWVFILWTYFTEIALQHHRQRVFGFRPGRQWLLPVSRRRSQVLSTIATLYDKGGDVYRQCVFAATLIARVPYVF